ILEKLVAGLLILVAVNFCAVLIGWGYRFTVGPFSTSARHLRNPLLLFLILLLVKFWLRDARTGISAGTRLWSPYVLFLGLIFIYSLDGTIAWSCDPFPAR